MSTGSKVQERIQADYRDLGIEDFIVAYLLRKSTALSSMLKEEWFSSAAHRALFRIARKEKTRHTRSSLKRSIEEKRGSKMLVSRADRIMRTDLSVADVRSVHLHINQLFDLYVFRSVLEKAYSVLRRAAKQESSLQELRSEVSAMYRVSSLSLDSDDRSGEILEDYERQVRDILNEQKRQSGIDLQPIPTGLKRFDAIVGGVVPGEFGVLVGKPAVGKTAALVSFALHAWRMGRSVVFISGEMQKRDVMHRMYSNLTGIPAQHYRMRSLTREHMQQWEREVYRLRRQQESILEVVGMNRSFSVESICDEIDRVEEKWGTRVDMICVDYLNIMRHSRSDQSNPRDWSHQSEVVWDVKALCEDRKIACWTAGQVSDEGASAKRLDLSHVKYARSISETAPIVVGLLRNENDELEGRIRLQIMKLRNAPSVGDVIPLNPRLDVMRLHSEELPEREGTYLDDL